MDSQQSSRPGVHKLSVIGREYIPGFCVPCYDFFIYASLFCFQQLFKNVKNTLSLQAIQTQNSPWGTPGLGQRLWFIYLRLLSVHGQAPGYLWKHRMKQKCCKRGQFLKRKFVAFIRLSSFWDPQKVYKLLIQLLQATGKKLRLK